MLTCKTAFTIALLTLALTVLALGCAPAAPPVQDSAPAPAAAEPEPTATPTPLPETSPPADLEYVAQAVYRLAEQQNRGAAGASGASSGPQLPERIYVYVTAWTPEVDDLERMLRDNGATDISVIKDGEVSIVESQAPPTLLPDITRHRAFLDVFTYGIYPNMEQSLNDALTMYAGGVFTAAEIARKVMRDLYFTEYPENIIVKVELDDPESYASVRDFLAARNAFPHDIKSGESWFYAGVPVAIMDDLYSHEGVVYIDRYPLYRTEIEEPSSSFVSGTSQVTSARQQGARAHGALAWHPGNTGQNVRVGIIDTGFIGFTAQMGKELPASVHYSCYNPMTGVSSTGSGTPDAATCAITTDHGTMVAEAIYDVAPGAILYISNDNIDEASDWMTDNGVEVINHPRSTGWDGPGDGTSKKARSSLNAVKKAVSDGALWVNSAGNYAETSWFKRNVQVNRTTSGTFVRFSDTDDCNDVSLKAGREYDFQLRWKGIWDGSNDDLSVQVWRNEVRAVPDGTSVNILTVQAMSNNVQQRGVAADTDPYDLLTYSPRVTDTNYCLRVKVPDSTALGWVQVHVWNSNVDMEHHDGGQSIVQPGDSSEAGMLTVGAADWHKSSNIQSYSGIGPTRDGRIKPDLVGSDEVYVVSRGDIARGTSQAAPHIAGLAALLLKRHPSYTPELLAHFLKSNAKQRTTTDPNNTWGHGFAWLPSPTARPAKPTGLTGTGRNGGVTLSWNDARNATKYVVQQWDGRASRARFRTLDFTETGGTYRRTYTHEITGAGAKVDNLVNGVSYAYRIKSVNGTLDSPWTRWITVTAVSSLTTPTGLRGTSRHRGVALNWNDVAGATAYRVQQWDGRAGGWRTLPFRESHVNYDYTITFSGSSARIGNLTNGVNYAHRVQAYKTDDESGWSGWIGTTARGLAGDSDAGVGGAADPSRANPTPAPPPNPGASDGASGQNAPPPSEQQAAPTPTPPMPQNEPSGLTAALADGAVVLHWMPGSNPHYVKQVVKRREAGVRPEVWTDFELDVSAHTYTDRTAASGTTYIYRVKGLRDNGRGGTSGRAAVTVP